MKLRLPFTEERRGTVVDNSTQGQCAWSQSYALGAYSLDGNAQDLQRETLPAQCSESKDRKKGQAR